MVIAGDFQQLPPILQTEQQSIHDILAHDVFKEAGITLEAVTGEKIPRLVMLDEQFRMDALWAIDLPQFVPVHAAP